MIKNKALLVTTAVAFVYSVGILPTQPVEGLENKTKTNKQLTLFHWLVPKDENAQRNIISTAVRFTFEEQDVSTGDTVPDVSFCCYFYRHLFDT